MLSGLHRLFVIGLLMTTLPVAAETAEEAFERGNEAYAAGDWSTAAAEYRTVLDFRVQDARVHYNLGNSEFRLGRLGPAILHYEKAKRLDPSDREIRANLGFVQGYRFDRVEVAETFLLIKKLQEAQEALGLDGQAWIVVGLLWISGGLLAWGLARPGKFGPGYGWVLTALAILLLVTGLSWWNSFERLERRRFAVVMAPATEVIAGPGPSNPSLLTIHEGLTVEILEEREDWIQVSLPNGINGWIATQAVGRV